MAVCEIGVTNPDDTFGNESRSGIPFTFVIRDILQVLHIPLRIRVRMSNAALYMWLFFFLFFLFFFFGGN
jgi:hypothetical protein